MTYRFYCQSKNMLCMTERYSRSKISYYSEMEMKEMYPNSNYEVIGEIGNFAKRYFGQDVIEVEMGKYIYIFPRGSLKAPFEWITGYSALGENIYVAVIKSIIPRFIW